MRPAFVLEEGASRRGEEGEVVGAVFDDADLSWRHLSDLLDNVVNWRMHQAMTGPGLSRAKPVGFQNAAHMRPSLRLVATSRVGSADTNAGQASGRNDAASTTVTREDVPEVIEMDRRARGHRHFLE